MKKNEEDLSRPSVEVKIPQVRLRLQDLAYMRSLAQPGSIRCAVGSNVKDRLRFLDLIAQANVPPSEEAIAAAEKEEQEWIKTLTVAVGKKDWQAVHDMSYKLRYSRDKLKPKVDDVLTDKGRALLRNGEVVVRTRKAGCI